MAKIEVKVDTRRLRLKHNKVNKKAVHAWSAVLPKLIVTFIKKGVSPVKGQRFAPYTDSYKAQIRGEAAFRTGKNGKVFAIKTTDLKQFTSKYAKSHFKEQNEPIKEKIAEMNKDFLAHGKRLRPINLTLSGKMLDSMFSKVENTKLVIGFTDEKASYHNEGTDKIVRRAMLPTNKGEEFNKNITLRLREIARLITIKTFG